MKMDVKMDVKMSFFEVMSEDVSAGIGQNKYIYKVLNKFSCNLRSKLARSTLTSPCLIRVNPSKNKTQSLYDYLVFGGVLQHLPRP
jgi:hypothetical protein